MEESISLAPTVEIITSIMFAKLLIVSAIAAVALAVQYPAGIHPAVCPNYPYCDAEVLARHTPQGMPIPEWELPYARVASAYVPGFAGLRPAQYPEGVDPAVCPNYPYCY